LETQFTTQIPGTVTTAAKSRYQPDGRAVQCLAVKGQAQLAIRKELDEQLPKGSAGAGDILVDQNHLLLAAKCATASPLAAGHIALPAQQQLGEDPVAAAVVEGLAHERVSKGGEVRLGSVGEQPS
jgi:hypothetical protein